jgi:CheY-like chemotaxis protein
MNSPPGAARVLVASDNADDATGIVEQLKRDFAQIRTSTDPDKAVDDFEACQPGVLVLGFNTIDKAKAYALALYRDSRMVLDHAHRTVLLCDKDEIRLAFDLCRQGSFDDYVPYWPHAHDGLRLSMCIWNVARQNMAAPDEGPNHVDLIAHVRQLGAMRSVVRELIDESEARANLGQSLRDRLLPHLDALGGLAEKVRKIQPIVMIVDDDEFSRTLAERTLDGKGYELVFAPDGMTALAMLQRERPDLILMDVNLPDIDGVALTQRLKALPGLAEIPVVMVTGEARRETLESSISAGAAGFIVKPFVREALIAKLDRFLSTTA